VRAWVTYGGIIIFLLALVVGYPQAEAARSDRLRAQDEPSAKALGESQHTIDADCADCHKPHALSKEHSTISCAHCHFVADLPEALSSPDESCAGCHREAAEAFPPLSVFRFAASRGEFRAPGELLQPTCASCHQGEMYDRPLAALTHPTRSVGSHLSCTECHDLFAGSLNPAAWVKADYESSFCFSCHGDQRRAFALSDTHSILRQDVSCRGCHPPHEPFAANITIGLLEMMGKLTVLAYDPIDSNALCLRCHGYIELAGPESRFSLGAGFSLHDLHLSRAYTSCVECHSPHGGGGESMVRATTLEGEPLLHFTAGDTGSCTVTCHDKHHSASRYMRSGS